MQKVHTECPFDGLERTEIWTGDGQHDHTRYDLDPEFQEAPADPENTPSYSLMWPRLLWFHLGMFVGGLGSWLFFPIA